MFGRKKLSFVIPVIFFFFFFLFFLASSASFGKSLPPKDQQFKNENLASLKLWGPDYDEKEAEKWREFIRIAAENEDLEIANKFLVLKETFHGDLPGQYPLALFELYKRNPFFFVSVIHEHFKGDFRTFLSCWINNAEDVQYEEVEKYGGNASSSETFKIFLKAALTMDLELKAERKKRTTEDRENKNEFQKDVTGIIKWHQRDEKTDSTDH